MWPARALLAAVLAAGAAGALAAGPPDVVEASVADLQGAMKAGRLTSKALAQRYLERIRAIDKAGPRLNSVIEVNPDALKQAAALDAERKAKGPRGPLHGIPVLLKDNVATADRMQTTAGSLALVGAKPPRDAFVVAKLREAGAVILGKTNLSEWANFRSTRPTSGWSSRGGLTRNPYALDRNPSGSSSGSAVAVAASLAAVAVGTETDGSIVAPASANNIVGIKPTVGLVSRAGIVPISASQDTAGPMARSVADAAALLTAMAGTDPADAATADASARRADYTRALSREALKGARLGVVRRPLPGADLIAAELEKSLEVLKAQGATLVDIPDVAVPEAFGELELTVLLFEFKAALADYLGQYAPDAEVRDLAGLIDYNDRNRAKVMPWFGQERFVAAQAKGGLDSAEYRDALVAARRAARVDGIDKALAEHRLDALVAPTASLPWLTDLVRGDDEGGGFTSLAAVAGYPHVTVPAGFVHGLPFGLSFVGTAWSEQRLIGFAFAFEQASKHRRAPTYRRTINSWGPS